MNAASVGPQFRPSVSELKTLDVERKSSAARSPRSLSSVASSLKCNEVRCGYPLNAGEVLHKSQESPS